MEICKKVIPSLMVTVHHTLIVLSITFISVSLCITSAHTT